MKIKLERLGVHNFKKFEDVCFDFAKVTEVSGCNGIGKSTIFDAFNWLLFGKNANDRKDFSVRRIKDGEPLHDESVFVEAVLNIDGDDVLLKRVQTEKYDTNIGNYVYETTCYVNGVKKTQNEFNKIFFELSFFKILSNPLYLAEKLHWKERRDFLLNIFGDGTLPYFGDEYEEVLKKCGGDLYEYENQLKQLLSDKKSEQVFVKYNIGATKQKIDGFSSFVSVEKQLQDLKSELNVVNSSIDNASMLPSSVLEHNNEILKKIDKFECKKLENINSFNFDKSSKEMALKNLVSSLQYELRDYAEREKKIKAEILDYNNELVELRDKWKIINELVFDGYECKLCGKKYEGEDLEKEIAVFNNSKIEEKNKINEIGKKIKSLLQEKEKELKNLQDAKEHKSKEYYDYCLDLEELQNIVFDESENVLIDADIDQLKGEIKVIETETEDLVFRRDNLLEEIFCLEREMCKNHVKDEAQKSLYSLENKLKEVGATIAEIEGEIYLINNYNKKKAIYWQEKISNAIGGGVSVKMTETLQNGSEVPICEFFVDGVPFSDVNTSGRINAGIRIINAVGGMNNNSSPIFIDNAESINNIAKSGSQLILLRVSETSYINVKTLSNEE